MGGMGLRELAEGQHGVVSRDQCRSIGLDAVRLRSELAAGRWLALSPRVLRLVGAPITRHMHVAAAVLDADPGAVASHRTAAALWRLPGFRLLPAEVSRLHGGDYEPAVLGRAHHPRLLPSHHCTVVEGVPVTTPARTLFDLAGVLPPARTERAVDNALAMSPALLRALHRMLPELAQRGRTGITAMRAILADRPAGYIAPASGLEARVVRLLDDAGIRTRRQVDVGGDDWIGRVDLLVVGTRLVIEVDSARFHSSKLDRERDERRDAELRERGYEVVRVTEEDAWHRPAEVVRRIRLAA
jgi:very-short-patch-repair endonuclease